MTIPSVPTSAVRVRGLREPRCPWPLTVTDPATGDPIEHLVGGGDEDATAAVDVAEAALPVWADTAPEVRSGALAGVAADLRDPATAEELAVLVTRETGKRLAEARAEIAMSAGFFDFFAAEIRRTGPVDLAVVPGVAHHVHSRALGVVVASTPWNFPVSIPARKLAAALAAGCTVVFKPSEIAPLSGLRLAELVERRVPDGVLGTLVGEARTLTTAWLTDARVRGFTFTGSTGVGTAIAGMACANLTRCVLELGGNAPLVVLDEHDEQSVLDLVGAAKYRNNGQSCIAANVVWVPRRHLARLSRAMCEQASALRIGDPHDPGTDLGPLALPTDPARMDELASDAEGHGAHVHRGGRRAPTAGQFARPVVAVEPDRAARVVIGESFGPALAVLGYDDLDEPIACTRSNAAGLAAYVAGSDPGRAGEVARRLDAGIVGVNCATPNTPHIPFGGLKTSGVGWEGGRAGLEAFLAPQTVATATPGGRS